MGDSDMDIKSTDSLITNGNMGDSAKWGIVSTELAEIYAELGLIMRTVSVINGIRCYVTVNNIEETVERWGIII